jgi:hypothetical protein
MSTLPSPHEELNFRIYFGGTRAELRHALPLSHAPSPVCLFVCFFNFKF